MEIRLDAGRLPTEIITRVGKYAVVLVAAALLYKIYQVYTVQRWSQAEIARNIQKGIAVESWRQTQLLFHETFNRVSFCKKELLCSKSGALCQYSIDQNPFLTTLKIKKVFQHLTFPSDTIFPYQNSFENEKMQYVFKALDNGRFELVRTRIDDGQSTTETYDPQDRADAITACAYAAGQIFIARGKSIGRFDLVERLEVRNWLKCGHDITDLSFDEGVLYAVGPEGLTSWDFRRKTEPGIIDQIFDRVLRLF